ncbi:hypothetical protein CIG37_06845 [Serratia marcescens]|nr:hypothetical protein CIG46_05330 [Serratia marcescens]OZP54034.1 hypothetical protein CIG37_06845 [Serratia marcescens]OZP59117.1 hypothetical protein CIG56_06840 [Serratia marcescens]
MAKRWYAIRKRNSIKTMAGYICIKDWSRAELSGKLFRFFVQFFTFETFKIPCLNSRFLFNFVITHNALQIIEPSQIRLQTHTTPIMNTPLQTERRET